MKKILLITLLFSLNHPVSNACQYSPLANNFLDVLRIFKNSNNSYFNSFTLTIGNVASVYKGYGAKYHVQQHLFGPTINDTVVVWGNTGIDCRWGIHGTPSFDTIIAFIAPIGGPSGPDEQLGDYDLHPATWGLISVRNDSVFGGGYACCELAMSLSDFIDSVNAIKNAPATGLGQNQNLKIRSVTLFPNPVGQQLLHITIAKGTLDDAVVQIFSVSGQLLYTENEPNQFQSDLPIDVSTYAPGIYFCVVQFKDGYKEHLRFQKE